jgi:hypothetical protein
VGKAKSVKFGTMNFLRHMESVDMYYRKYESIVFRINNKMADKVVGDDPMLDEASAQFGYYNTERM